MSSVLCFFKSTMQVCNYLFLNSIKTALKTLIFLKKVDFCIFEPKNRKVIENSSKTPLNFLVHYRAHTLAKIYFNITRAKSGKKKLKSGYLELRFSVW